jgi:hypothetical protein
VGEDAPDGRSVVCSAAMSFSSSRSLLYSGEGDASSAPGVVIISPLLSAGTLAKHGLSAVVYGGADGTRSAACSRQ